jgi:hypothetical protein
LIELRRIGVLTQIDPESLDGVGRKTLRRQQFTRLGTPLVWLAGDRARFGLRRPQLLGLELHGEFDVVDVLTFALRPVGGEVFLVDTLADHHATAAW